MINIQNLSKRYGKKEVLHSLNLSINQGMVYGIVGENGAGKTTLFRCIAGLESYEGQITSELPKLKNRLGFLPTEPYFFSKITGKEYIQLLVNARQINIPSIQERNIFDLPLDQYASTYSSGMKKKLALTAILLQENEIYILDEPFNGVDIQSNLIITEIIKELKRLNKTVIISSHIFSTLSDTCDEVYLLKQGEIARKVSGGAISELEDELKKQSITGKIEQLGLK